MPTTTYTDSPMLRSLLVGTLAALGLVWSAAAGGAAASCAPSPKGPEAYLLQARRLYPTAAWCGLTNSLVDAFLDPTATVADRPVPQGRIRWHHVPGMRNVRDIGGWNGLPTGRVFRGSEPDCLPIEQVGEKRFHRLGVTEAGLRTMREELRIRTDLDLRAASECPHPDVSALGVRLVRVPLGAYLGAFTATNQYAQALRVFAARGNYPIYFHCWGGADRTGTLAYLVEGLCGVSEADLAVDYELTSFARVFGLRRRTGTPHPETGRPECAFPAFVARLKDYPGGTMAEKIAAYMERTLGLAKAEIAAIRNNVMGEGTSVPDVRETVVRLDDLTSARIWASAKDGKTPFVLTPLVGETDWTEGKAGYLQAGAYETWNETAFTLTAKGDGRFFVGLSAPHNVRRLYPEVAWTDISIAGAGRQENLDFAHGLTFWGVNTKDAPRIETVAGRRALVVRADRGRYRGLDLKAGDTVTVRAKFRLMGPSAAPARQRPLDVSAAVNAPVPEGVALPCAKRDFIGIYVKTPDPAAHGGAQCVRFRNRAVQPGAAAVTLLDGAAEPSRYLYLLLSSRYTKGPDLATVAVTYADGTADTLAITKGRELADWSHTLNGDACQTVFSANGENGTRHFMLARVVLDERKAPVKIALATAENSNLSLYGATLTSADWKPVRAENVTFRLGGEWRLPDMPGRDIVAGSALDLSGQIDFAPCGTYGRVVQRDGRLCFEKRPDRPLRFFGNHSSSQWVCDWEPDADRYCEQMRRVGCNAIRLSIHRLGCDWWDERADCLRRHPHADGFFRDDRIDNFLRFVAAFNRHGIYFLMGSGGGPQEIEAMMAGDAESLEYYRQFTIRLLNRRNPYTGNLVKDEPCLLGWEFANEQSVQHVQHIVAEVPNPDAPRSSFHPVQAKYAARVRTLVKPRWEAFLKKKYGDGWARHAAYPKRYTEKTPNALDFQLFSQELMEAQIRFYRDVMKEAGWDRPTMWGNYDKILRTTETRVKTGMATEVNNYHSFLADDGHGPQVSSATDGMAAFRDIAGAAIPGQPVVVTEYNDCQHNRYCHEMGLAAGAVAALQGWDAFFLHNSTVLTDGLTAPPSFNMNDGLVIANHFSMRASTFLAACLYGRGDAVTSPHTVTLDYTKAFMGTLSSTSYPDPQQLRAVMLCGVRVDWPEYGATPGYKADLSFPGFGNDTAGTYEFLLAQASDSKARTAVLEAMVARMRAAGVLGPANRTDVRRGVYESDTGELLVESALPRMRVATQRSEAVSLPANGAYRAGCLEIVRTKNNATFAAVAVDGRPLAASGRIVVVMDGESGIDGAVKTPDLVRFVGYRTKEGRARMQGRKIGRANVAQVRLRNARGGRFTLYPLSVNGIRRAPAKVTRAGDALAFTLDTTEAALPDGLTPFFELVAEDGP